MDDIEKVVKGLENCSTTNGNCQWKEHQNCPYVERCKNGDYSALNRDALKLLKKIRTGEWWIIWENNMANMVNQFTTPHNS